VEARRKHLQAKYGHLKTADEECWREEELRRQRNRDAIGRVRWATAGTG
jgi:hypothetical protein